MIQTETKRGILVHVDTLKTCLDPLSTMQRGELFQTILAQYYPETYKESGDQMVNFAAHVIRLNIANNDARYEKRKAKQQAAWDRYNERKKTQKTRNNANIANDCNDLQASQNIANASNAYSNTDSNTNTNTNSNTYTNTDSNTYSVKNTLNNNVNNNNLSKIKYTLPQVRELLERERIFFKQNWLRDFYHLNTTHFGWKYDPVTAAHTYLARHPEAERKGEGEAAPHCAAPQMAQEMQKIAKEAADKLWAQVYSTLAARVEAPDVELLRKITPLAAERTGLSDYRLYLGTDDEDHAQAVDVVITAWHQDVKALHVAKIIYKYTDKPRDHPVPTKHNQ